MKKYIYFFLLLFLYSSGNLQANPTYRYVAAKDANDFVDKHQTFLTELLVSFKEISSDKTSKEEEKDYIVHIVDNVDVWIGDYFKFEEELSEKQKQHIFENGRWYEGMIKDVLQQGKGTIYSLSEFYQIVNDHHQEPIEVISNLNFTFPETDKPLHLSFSPAQDAEEFIRNFQRFTFYLYFVESVDAFEQKLADSKEEIDILLKDLNKFILTFTDEQHLRFDNILRSIEKKKLNFKFALLDSE